jgi:hypothetical protein
MAIIAPCPTCGTYETRLVEEGIMEHHFRCVNTNCSARGMIFASDTYVKGLLKGFLILAAIGGGIAEARERLSSR